MGGSAFWLFFSGHDCVFTVITHAIVLPAFPIHLVPRLAYNASNHSQKNNIYNSLKKLLLLHCASKHTLPYTYLLQSKRTPPGHSIPIA
jgi:hypothetical protein